MITSANPIRVCVLVVIVALAFAACRGDEGDGAGDPVDSGSPIDASDAATDTGDDSSDGLDTADDGDDVDSGSRAFEPFVGRTDPPDVRVDRLCPAWADPEAVDDKIFIDCAAEGANFAPEDVPPRDELLVMTYNFERGVHLDEQLDALLEDDRLPIPDIFLISEVDRGCSRSGGRNVMWELAEALEMNYVFGVEFVELPRPGGTGGDISETCEHGNAVASRYPIGNVRVMRHEANRSWYLAPDERDGGGEPRLGGRVAIAADVLIGDRIVHVYSIHFESNPGDAEVRDAQALEIAEDGLLQPGPVIIAGDTNAPLYFFDLQTGSTSDATTQVFFERGYVDAHAPLSFERRGTAGQLVIDLIFGGDDFFTDPGVCPRDLCGDLSDHLPVWATVQLD